MTRGFSFTFSGVEQQAVDWSQMYQMGGMSQSSSQHLNSLELQNQHQGLINNDPLHSMVS